MKYATQLSFLGLALLGCDLLDITPDTAPNPDYVACMESRQSAGCVKFCNDRPSDPICTDAGHGGDGTDGGDGADGSVETCTSNSECSDPAVPRCDGANCTTCAAEGDCARFPATPACGQAGACVECTETSTEACKGATPVCEDGATQCVECNENADCIDPTKPICDGHACRGCTNDGDCVGEGKVCAEATGACAECEPNREDAALENCANGRACDPATLTCTGAPRGSLSTCDKCVSDSECGTGTKCVPTNFAATAHGTYCLLVAPESPTLCPNQYAARRSASSALGEAGDYCFPNDTFTTCEGVLDFKNACVDLDENCGADGLNDGLCRFGACTYGCDGRRDCSGSTDTVNKCIGTIEKYCDPN